MEASELTAGTSSTALTGPGVAAKLRPRNESGQVAEWLKAHAWRACKRLKPFRGFESLPVRRAVLHPQAPSVIRGPRGTSSRGAMLRWGRKSSTPDVEPATIGRYRVTGRLGEGGMGVVYAAHDDRLDRPVAVKRIREVSSDPGLKERLVREARAAASISHPHVCHVYELAEEGDELYLVMERLAGEPLSDRIAREAVPLAEALQICLGILGALEALHGRGVVHRDLKPSNVFLTPHGVKLLDFGLARPLVEQLKSDSITLTQPGTIVGTPRYMPPEQWEGEPYVPASDLFAVGAILFEMLAGKAAFPGNTIIEVYRAVAMAQPPALTGGSEVVAADRIIQVALAKRPADRYPDAAAMAREVRSAWALIDTGSSP